MGTPDFAVECLDVLVKSDHNIVAVVTSEDKQAGRGQKIKTSDVKDYSLKKNLKILQPKNLKDSNFINEIKNLNIDIFIVVAFRMLPKILWEIPEKGTINLHASILPNLRGAAPIHWAIINGLKETGVSTFYINEKIDCGEIIEQKRVPISKNENTGELYIKLKKIGAITILSTLEKISSKNFKGIKQNESEKYLKAPKLNRENTRIQWKKSTNEINNFVRGLSPFPSAWSSVNNKIIKIYKSREYSNTIEKKLEPGTIMMNKNTLLVSTGNGLLEVLELKLEGKKMMTNIEFNNGFNSLNMSVLS
jgi:methionyl-tRNA formyltransferase